MSAQPSATFSRVSFICSALSTAMTLASPFVFYALLSNGNVQYAAFIALGWVVLRSLPKLLTLRGDALRAALRLPLLGVGCALVGLVTRDGRALLLLPPANQAAFALVFFLSLRSTPLVEHFARMSTTDLQPDEVVYCRQVTIVWAVALTLAAVVGVATAFFSPLYVWTLVTGVGSYALVVVLFSVEYVVRVSRFGVDDRTRIGAILGRVLKVRRVPLP